MTDKRPCLIKDKKALFHMWFECAKVVPPSLMIGGHSGGIIKDVFGLVEFEDGSVSVVYPYEIKFIDNPFRDYYFNEEAINE